ncbi:MAG TPA: cysteine synthase family protein [Longimicrobium sp.]
MSTVPPAARAERAFDASLVSPSIIDAIALPRLIRLRPNLIGMAFTLMKLLPARHMVDRAAAEGELPPGGLIAETTSGTFGLSLAMLANQRGYRLTLVSDPAIDPPLRRRLEQLGATVHMVTQPSPEGGYQRPRLEALEKILAGNPGSWCPRQYTNPHNPGAYAACAEQLRRAVGPVDCIVGTVGSGGSMSGLASHLRATGNDVRAVGVDTHGSVIFGLSDAGAGRLLRGLGNSLMPANVDHRAFDDVHWVSAAEGFHATRRLHREHALFMGPTSGAAFMVADWYARRNPDELVAVLLPDEGYRYQDTVYDDAWLEARGVRVDEVPAEPVPWEVPHDGPNVWSHVHWARRGFDEVMRPQPAEVG